MNPGVVSVKECGRCMSYILSSLAFREIIFCGLANLRALPKNNTTVYHVDLSNDGHIKIVPQFGQVFQPYSWMFKETKDEEKKQLQLQRLWNETKNTEILFSGGGWKKQSGIQDFLFLAFYHKINYLLVVNFISMNVALAVNSIVL